MNREKGGCKLPHYLPKKPSVVNRQPVTVSLALQKGVTQNTIFSRTILQTIKAEILTKNNASVSGILGENFKLEIVVPQISKE